MKILLSSSNHIGLPNYVIASYSLYLEWSMNWYSLRAGSNLTMPYVVWESVSWLQALPYTTQVSINSVHGSVMVTFFFPTSPLLIYNMKHVISTRCLATPKQGRSCFPHNFQSSCEYLIHYQSSDSRVSLNGHLRHPQLCWQLNLMWLSYFEHTF